MKYLKRQEGMVLPLVVGLVAVVIVVIGLAVYQSEQAKSNKTASSPTPTPTAQASSTPTPSPAVDSYAVALAAADQYCKTHSDASGKIDSSLVFKASPNGAGGTVPARYSRTKVLLCWPVVASYPVLVRLQVTTEDG